MERLMKKDNVVLEKSYAFALRIIKMYRHIVKSKKEYVLSKQVLRSGTSIGANMEEAQGAQSKKDFIAKISISYKEARETHYWLRLLRDSQILDADPANSMIEDCEELLKLISTILTSSKKKQLKMKN
jgi:four helix bundle protein